MRLQQQEQIVPVWPSHLFGGVIILFCGIVVFFHSMNALILLWQLLVITVEKNVST